MARIVPRTKYISAKSRQRVIPVRTTPSGARAATRRSQAGEIGLGRFPNGGALVELPEPGGVPIDSDFAAAGLEPARAADEDVLQQCVQELVHAGVDREERHLIAMRIAKRDQADVIAVLNRGHSRQRAAVVPFHGNVVGQDEVDDAAAQPDEDRPIAGGSPHLAGSVGGLESDAAAAEVPDSFGPNRRPEVVQLLRRAPRPGIHDSMNGHQQPRLGRWSGRPRPMLSR